MKMEERSWNKLPRSIRYPDVQEEDLGHQRMLSVLSAAPSINNQSGHATASFSLNAAIRATSNCECGENYHCKNQETSCSHFLRSALDTIIKVDPEYFKYPDIVSIS